VFLCRKEFSSAYKVLVSGVIFSTYGEQWQRLHFCGDKRKAHSFFSLYNRGQALLTHIYHYQALNMRIALLKRLVLVSTSAAFLLTVVLPQISYAAATLVQNPPAGGSGTVNAGSADACANVRTTGLKGVVQCFVGLLNTVMYLLIAASVVYTVYGAFLMISSEEKRDEGKKIIYHGIIGLFVMVSIWGLVNILDNTFKLSGQTPIPAPQLRAP
jgi:hypothetical protein